ncbi:hypothetical protein ABZ178_07340 [Streptomyces massasporeus]|uniref:hypothetical protein n=1 Tax=Streptomyces massasporeus TaxID=67324 RepID=UPI00167A4212|nr:hypothetical protein [Streptomyces massasporeus]GGV84302.1 hypothetical protein GCM10010228_61840 [Streptomyces massasporeus]
MGDALTSATARYQMSQDYAAIATSIAAALLLASLVEFYAITTDNVGRSVKLGHVIHTGVARVVRFSDRAINLGYTIPDRVLRNRHFSRFQYSLDFRDVWREIAEAWWDAEYETRNHPTLDEEFDRLNQFFRRPFLLAMLANKARLTRAFLSLGVALLSAVTIFALLEWSARREGGDGAWLAVATLLGCLFSTILYLGAFIARLFDMVFTRAMEAAVMEFISAHGIELETERPEWRPYRYR